MTWPPTNAELLGIQPGSLVWIVGDSVEETALLDPLPDDVETYQDDDPEAETGYDDTWTGTDLLDGTESDVVRPSGIDTAVIAVSNSQEFHTRLDDLLPRLGSVTRVWIVFPVDELPLRILDTGVAEYGWTTDAPVALDETWSAVELHQP